MIQTLFGSHEPEKSAEEESKRGLFDRMRQAVSRTRESFSQKIADIAALAANVRFCHPVGADGRPRRSIHDGDAALEDFSERMNWRLSHFVPMIYGLLLKHIGLVNPPEPIRAELRPPGLDGHNRWLNG